MSGDFKLDKEHGKYPDHLDHIQWGDFGNFKTRYDRDGKIIDSEFNLSNKWSSELRTDKK